MAVAGGYGCDRGRREATLCSSPESARHAGGGCHQPPLPSSLSVVSVFFRVVFGLVSASGASAAFGFAARVRFGLGASSASASGASVSAAFLRGARVRFGFSSAGASSTAGSSTASTSAPV